MNAPERLRPDFSAVTYDEAIASATALIPVLRERAARCEAAGELLPENAEDLHATGLARALQPKRWGGMELPFPAIFDIPEIIARGCISTAWNLSNLLAHHWMLAFYDERAQEEVWNVDRDAFIASGIAFPQGRGRKVDGGIELSGLWNFSSAVTPSTWNMLACVVRDGDTIVDYRMCLVPMGEYEVLDDWHVMGLRGTGSRSVKCDKVFVPEHRALSMIHHRRGEPFPGWRTNTAPVFHVPFGGLSGHCLLGTVIGNAQAMFDAITDMIRERSTSYTTLKMRDLQTVQARVGLAGAMIDAARAMARADCVEGQRMAEQNIPSTLELRLKQKRNCAFGAKLATEAVDTLYALAGANGLYTRGPMERIFRDQHAAASHISFSIDAQTSAWGLAALGGEINNPVL
ncbi:MAG: hypothetical protein JNM90_00600 [Burkholderiales bacterium]|nr:hypothetical protein [Burkholderiales bacterium]